MNTKRILIFHNQSYQETLEPKKKSFRCFKCSNLKIPEQSISKNFNKFLIRKSKNSPKYVQYKQVQNSYPNYSLNPFVNP